MAALPFDLTGCTVTKVKSLARDFQLTLAGETAAGRSVAGCMLTFQSVANLYELSEFLRTRRRIIRKPGLMSRNTVDPYPLKLPATLTHLKPSRAKVGYGDAAFTDAHGQPPAVGPGQQLYLFAVAEKRFTGRKPFPVVCGQLMLTDKKGNVLSGTPAPARRQWPTDVYEQLGMKFFVAIVTGDLISAQALLSNACRKRLGKAKAKAAFLREIRDYFGSVDRYAEHRPAGARGKVIDEMLPQMTVNVEANERMVWDSLQGMSADFDRESVRAVLDLCSEFCRESIAARIVEEDGEPRIDV